MAFAINYTGTTQNTGNTVTSTHIVVNQSGYSDTFDKKIIYNTETNNSGTTYTLNTAQDGYAATRGSGSNPGDTLATPSVLLGSVTLTVTQTQNPDSSYDSYVLQVKHDVAISGTYYIGYYIGNDPAAEKYYAFDNAADSGYTTASITGAASTTIHVNIYITVAGSLNSAPNATPVNNAVFTFTATATE